MAAKLFFAVCVQIALFNVSFAQVLNRFPGFLPGCGGGPTVLPVAETFLPNQVILPNYPGSIFEVPYGLETIVSNPVSPATTIIQDSTVANNLANALQLLVVSNLLSNTLPSNNEVVVPVPSYLPMDYGVVPSVINSCGYGPYNYIY